jgi:hypothetical protein
MAAHAPRSAAPVDLARLGARFARERAAFAAATPFPHLVIDGFLAPAAAAAMAAEFDPRAPGWVFLHHVNERKAILNDVDAMGPVAREVVATLQSDAFVRHLGTLTGLPGLVADPSLDGGGLAITRPGGFLNVHADFLAHSKHRTWSRQVNLILFLSPGWREEYRGWLELWNADVTRCERRVLPAFNRAIVFQTSRTSFHGVPAGVASPDTLPRQSLALYYFRDEGRTCQLSPTRYVPLPGDGPLRRAAIRADRLLIGAYSYLKRYTPLGDRVVSRILRHF